MARWCIMTRPDRLLTAWEVAKAFAVDRKTVTRWAHEGKLHGIRTPGGHWRFSEDDVRKWLGDEVTS